ncbi:hypothetical protein BRD02_00465 [Halobacteriales archaeon QS_8_69_73]|nr:MAG: hypothetical protein BRD02_00465 [Halobacteriales archaeon QS_8_69_73]
MQDDIPQSDETDRFADASIDRRTFVRLSAAAGAALSLPGNAFASASDAAFDDEYEYVLNHTPANYAVPTLVRFDDAAGPAAMDAATDADTRTTTEPEPAAYAQLTAAQAASVSDLPTAETFTYAPGANPFWRLGYYPLGVFPDSERCVDFILYEEMIAGMERLAEQHPDRLDFYDIGRSPGWDNALSAREDPKPVYVAELTNDIDDEESYREKEKVFCSLSLHGDERAGAEGGCRFVEDLLDGREREIEQLLDDAVIVLAFTNPDGWVARHPQYFGKFTRGNAEIGDTNRQYPIVGWITPDHYPAEPRGADAEDDQDGIDSDVDSEYLENVPDTLAIVEHLRDYENLNYGADFHGASVFSGDFVFGLISQAQYDHRQFHELYGLNRDVDDALTEEIQPQPYTSNEYDYGTIWDLLGYTDSGIQGDWLAHPKSLGGLGMTSMDFEMAQSNIITSTYYDPNRNDKQSRGYKQGIRTLTKFAVQNSDTRTTSDEFSATVETGGNSTLVVTTDRLTRSSDQLVFEGRGDDGDGSDGDGGGARTTRVDTDTEVSRAASSLSLADGADATALSVPASTHTLSLDVEPDGPVVATLESPSGETVRSRDGTDGPMACGPHVEWTVREPEAGRWTLSVEPRTATDEVNGESVTADSVDVETTAVRTAQDGTTTPDPREVLGYGQFDYKVSPFVFFDSDFFGSGDDLRALDVERDLDDFTEGADVDTASVDAVDASTLQAYDNVVVIHDDGIDDEAYVGALDEFVDSGGNLVVTDTGVSLLSAMDNTAVGGLGADATVEETYYVANLGDKRPNQPMLDGARLVQTQLWKVAGLGYSVGTEAPMTIVDRTAFDEAGGIAAGVQDGGVSAGSFIGETSDLSGEVTTRELVDSDAGAVHFVGGLFPPASQANLHPFGVLDYSPSFLGYLMMTNALGYVQTRSIEGETTATFGGESTFTVEDGVATPTLEASGSRSDDGSVFTGGQTDRVVVTVTELSEAAEVADGVPDGWTVDTDYGDADSFDAEAGTVSFGERGPVDPEADDDPLELEYYAEAPEGATATGRYTFGPAEATATVGGDEVTVEFAGTDTDTVVGPSTGT